VNYNVLIEYDGSFMTTYSSNVNELITGSYRHYIRMVGIIMSVTTTVGKRW